MPLQAVSTPFLFSSHSLSIDSLPAVKRLDGIFGRIQGWLLSCFDAALRIYDEKEHKHFYLRIRDIISNLCAIPDAALVQTISSTSKKITRLVLENLQPNTGETTTIEKVSRLFRAFRAPEFIQQLQNTNDCEEAGALAAERLENLKNRHLTVIPLMHLKSHTA